MKIDLAERDAISGRLGDARKELVTASFYDPTNSFVRQRLGELAAADSHESTELHKDVIPEQEIQIDYQTGTRPFDFRGDTQGAYEQVAHQFGVEVSFDVDLRSRQLRYQTDEVDFSTALRLLGSMTGTFWRPLT